MPLSTWRCPRRRSPRIAFSPACAAATRTQAAACWAASGSGNRASAAMNTSWATSCAAAASPTTPRAIRTTAG